jgi:hypothetical protein
VFATTPDLQPEAPAGVTTGIGSSLANFIDYFTAIDAERGSHESHIVPH